MSARVRDGYTKRDAAQILGTQLYRVGEWLERSWLAADSETGRITDASLTAFIRKHIDEIDFRLADQNYIKVFRHGTAKAFRAKTDEGTAPEPSAAITS